MAKKNNFPVTFEAPCIILFKNSVFITKKSEIISIVLFYGQIKGTPMLTDGKAELIR